MAAILQSLVVAQTSGAALTNTTVATSILPSQSKLTFPANYMDYIGRSFRVVAAGKVSNIVTTPGTLTLDLRLGSTVVFNGAAMQLSTTAHTDVPWLWLVELTVRSVGSSASLMGQGVFFSQAASVSGADSTTGHSLLMTPNTAPAVGNTFDSTTSLVLDCFGKFSVADTGNSITLTQFKVEGDPLY